MTGEELKEALMNRKPVTVKSPTLDKTDYLYISAIIYRKVKNKVKVFGEVMDKNLNSVTVVNAKFISYKE